MSQPLDRTSPLAVPVAPGTVPVEGTLTLSAWLKDRGLVPPPEPDSAGASERRRNRLETVSPTRYEVGKLVARGGMGMVMACRDTGLRREVAMKVMLDPGRSTNEQVWRFIEEAQVTGQLQHPNIVPVHELGVDAQGRIFYTMKLVHGKTLRSILFDIAKDDPDAASDYPLPKLLDLFGHVCDAIAFAHSQGIVHRDLKPANIMVGDFGEVLVMDWGLAKQLRLPEVPAAPTPAAGWAQAVQARPDGDEVVMTLEGVVMGTPCYMAPEQARGAIAEIAEPADIYALGAILYELLTLRRPIEESACEAVLAKTVNGEIVPPERHRRRGRPVPAALAAVVRKAMAVDPAQRYATVKALQADVDAYLNGFATLAEHAGFARQAWLLVTRHKAVSLLLALALTTIATVSTGFTLRVQREQQALLRVSRLAAPEFVDKARVALADLRLVEAEQVLAVAVGLDDESAAAYRERGHLRMLQHRFAEAAAEYRLSAQLNDAEDADLAALLTLAGECAKRFPEPTRHLLREELLWIAEQLHAIDQIRLAARFFDLGQRGHEALLARCEAAWRQLQADNPGLPESSDPPYRWSSDGLTWHLKPSKSLVNLDALRGLPLTTLAAPWSSVIDLGPLTGAPLQDLRLIGSPIADLSPLRDAKLRLLYLGSTAVRDLAPVAGMPLETLSVEKTSISDLAPVRGAPLKTLQISRTAVIDLSPLVGAPLDRIHADYTQISSLQPLAGMPLQYLNIYGTPVADLEPLRGCPLFALMASYTLVTDLEPLTGAPLRNLGLSCTPVTDLSPLAGMKLEILDIRGGPASSLEPLRDMPLREFLCDAKHLKTSNNLATLASLKDLEELTVTVDVPYLEPLRGLTTLKKVSSPLSNKKSIPVAEFWRLYDAQRPLPAPPAR